MIEIPQPIKYDKELHLRDTITEPLGLKIDLKFIIKVLSDLKRDNAEAYIVQKDNGKVMICRKGLRPAISEHMERHRYFALKNSKGHIIANGKNMRKPESIIGVLKGKFRHNPAKLNLLARNHDLTVAERCDLFNYTLCKQNTPFE